MGNQWPNAVQTTFGARASATGGEYAYPRKSTTSQSIQKIGSSSSSSSVMTIVTAAQSAGMILGTRARIDYAETHCIDSLHWCASYITVLVSPTMCSP